MNPLKEFDNYVSNYDVSDKDIKLKYDHSIRVMKLMEKYSKILSFNDYDIHLAAIIGLLHDIGRFEQLRIYHTYDDDKSIDHAEYGAKILFDDKLIEKFWDNKEDYELIKFSIRNHNKFEIEKITDNRILKFAKLIRDIDKMDIIYLMGNLYKYETTSDEISKKVKEDILNHKQAKKEDIKNKNDELALCFSFAFDINFDECINEFKENLDSFYKSLNDDKFKEIYLCVINYLKERMC